MTAREIVSGLISARTRVRLIRIEHRITRRLTGSRIACFAASIKLRQHRRGPREVDIEVTSACDADCIMCPRKAMRRKMGPMEFSLFTKVVDEAVALGARELALNGYGEFSMLKRYRDYLAYIRQKSRSIKIIINTNGMRMTEDLARAYINFSVDVVNVTIDGATAATYEQIRRHLRLEDVERNVKRLIELRNTARRRHPLVMVHMIRMPQNIHEVDLFRAKWTGVADYVGFSGLVSRLGSVDAPGKTNWEQTPCFLLWQQMPILSDGTVALCCDDWDGRGAVGDARTQSIKEIWTSPRRRELQALHLAGRAGEIKECAACQQPRQGPWWFSSLKPLDH